MVFVNSDGSLKFRWQVPAACDLIGPMTFNADVSLEGTSDATLLAAVRLIRGGVEIPFEGSYGFGRDVVTHGWHRLAHRELDSELSTPWQPVHTHAKAEPFSPGEVVPITVALMPQATRLRAGDVLELELRSQWLFAVNPFTGQLPARYAASSTGSTRLHLGGSHLAELRIPVAGG
jgi:predicted acyl esterase